MSTDFPTIETDADGQSILTDGTFCSVKWGYMWRHYSNNVHYPLLLFICIVGIVTNVLNLFIFTRSVMRNSSNFLLSVLAVTDFLCVFRKAIDVSLAFYRGHMDHRTSYHKNVENQINEICFYLFHTWSIYMTIVVALWRLVGAVRPIESRNWFSYKNAILVAAIFVGFATLLVPLLFVGSSIELLNSEPQDYDYQNDSSPVPLSGEHKQEYIEYGSNNDPDYEVTQTEFGESLEFWIHGLLIKLIPCLILLLSTIVLIISLRTELLGYRKLNADRARNHIPDEDDIRDFSKHTMPNDPPSSTRTEDFTSKMLIVILFVFLVTELPPGILAFAFGLIKTKKFFLQCYLPVRAFLNLNEYISSSVGFFIYLTMSGKFRQTFVQNFWNNNRPSEGPSIWPSILMSKVRLFPSKNVPKQIDATDIATDDVADNQC